MDVISGNPIVQSALIAFAVGAVLTGVLGLTLGRRIAWLPGTAIGLGVLLAFYLAYDRIPGFPPRGSTNKMFYLALAGLLVGLVVDVAPRRRWVPWAIIAIGAVAIPWWIGLPRLRDPSFGLFAALVAIPLGTLVVTGQAWRVATAADARAGLHAAILIGSLAAGFAPLALFGASAATFEMSLAVATTAAGFAVWNWPKARYAVAASGLLPAAAGLAGAASTTVLITQKLPWPGLVVLVGVPFAPAIARRLPGAASTAVAPLVVAAVAVAIAALAVYVGWAVLPPMSVP